MAISQHNLSAGGCHCVWQQGKIKKARVSFATPLQLRQVGPSSHELIWVLTACHNTLPSQYPQKGCCGLAQHKGKGLIRRDAPRLARCLADRLVHAPVPVLAVLAAVPRHLARAHLQGVSHIRLLHFSCMVCRHEWKEHPCPPPVNLPGHPRRLGRQLRMHSAFHCIQVLGKAHPSLEELSEACALLHPIPHFWLTIHGCKCVPLVCAAWGRISKPRPGRSRSTDARCWL